MNKLLSLTTLALASAALAAYPVSVQNCGNTLTFSNAPKRVVSLFPPTTEMLLRLGLDQKIVGISAKGASPVQRDLQAREARLKALGPFGVTKEVMLSARPDLVIDNQPSYFYDSKQGFATQAELKANGAQVYSMTSQCPGNTRPTIENVYTDLANLGRIFGVEGRANLIISGMKRTVADVQDRIKGETPVRVLFYFSGQGPFEVWTEGSRDFTIQLAGGRNVFPAEPQGFASVGAEAVAASNPDVIVVADYADPSGKTTTQSRVDFLKKTFPNVNAVRNNRVIAVPYEQMNPGVQNARGVLTLAKAFYPGRFK